MGNRRNLLKAKDVENQNIFDTERERISYMSNNYANMDIGQAFKEYYDLDIEVKENTDSKYEVVEIELGNIYVGNVKEINKRGIVFEIPGVKEDIICKENFSTCLDEVQNYIITHDNKLAFEVRERQKDKYIVSVMNAMYRIWKNAIEEAIHSRKALEVHIDSLTKGGYLCHTSISTLKELTGKDYTHSVFIPGSAIVLNIEKNFERWIGQNVYVIPQKFMEFQRNVYAGVIENSLVGSRKMVLQIQGNINLYEIYKKHQLTQNENFKSEPEVLKGHVTGIINSGKKTGVFVELDGMYITGLMPIEQMDLMNFKPGDSVSVYAKEFEVRKGCDPFVINKRGDIVRCNTRVVFGLAG